MHDLFLVYFVNFIYNLYISGFQPREALSSVVCKLTFCMCKIQVAEKKVMVLKESDLAIFEALTAVLLKIEVIMQCELVNMKS